MALTLLGMCAHISLAIAAPCHVTLHCKHEFFFMSALAPPLCRWAGHTQVNESAAIFNAGLKLV